MTDFAFAAAGTGNELKETARFADILNGKEAAGHAMG